MPPTGDLAHNPSMYPDWESNQQPFGLQAGTQSTEPHQQGQYIWFLKGKVFAPGDKIDDNYLQNSLTFIV